jgi:hypothetical protein
MPTPLTPQDLVLLQEDTDYLDAGIPTEGSAVMNWNGTTVLIYNSPTIGYVVTDISDLPASTIQNISVQSTVHGMLYYLPQAIADTISSEAETAVNLSKQAGQTGVNLITAAANGAGQAVAALTSPIVNSLMPLLVIAGLVLLVYLSPKKG